jgi:hypothetical protein
VDNAQECHATGVIQRAWRNFCKRRRPDASDERRDAEPLIEVEATFSDLIATLRGETFRAELAAVVLGDCTGTSTAEPLTPHGAPEVVAQLKVMTMEEQLKLRGRVDRAIQRTLDMDFRKEWTLEGLQRHANAYCTVRPALPDIDEENMNVVLTISYRLAAGGTYRDQEVKQSRRFELMLHGIGLSSLRDEAALFICAVGSLVTEFDSDCDFFDH